MEEGVDSHCLLAPCPHCWVSAPPPCPTFPELPVHAQLHWEGRGGQRPSAGEQIDFTLALPFWLVTFVPS